MSILKSKDIQFAALAVDIVCFRVLEGKLQFLMGKVTSENNPYQGKWAHIGGLVRVDEIAEESVDRLLFDKAGIKNIYKEQLYTFSEIDRDPRGRVVSVAYIALTSNILIQDNKKATMETMWCDVKKTPKLGYDHNKILKIAINRLKTKIIYTDIAKNLIDKEFTLSELQDVYEAVIEESLDKRNFRKRMMALDMLKEGNKKIKKGVMRPAVLYSFK